MHPAVAWTVGALCVGASVGGAVAFAAPVVARSMAVKAFAARGIDATIGEARVGWSSVTLSAVHARLEGTDVVAIDAGNIDVSWSFRGAGDVAAKTLTTTVKGDASEVAAAISAWRDRHHGGAMATPSQRTIALAGIDVTWLRAGDRDRHAHAETIAVRPAQLVVTGASAEARIGDVDVSASGLDATFDRATKRLTALSIGGVSVAYTPSDAPAPSTTDPPENKAISTQAPLAPRTPWPVALQLRALMDRAAPHLADELDVQVASVTIGIGPQRLGPWAARTRWTPRDVTFELLPRVDAGGRKPLELRAVVPRAGGAWSASMRLGPATLAELGAHDGLGGISDTATAKATAHGELTLDPDKEALTIDGALEFTGVSVTQPRLADGTIKNVEFKARGLLETSKDLSKWSLARGALSLGDVTLELDGSYERTHDDHPKPGADSSADPRDADGARVSGSWSLPTAACGEALASMPSGLLPKLDGLAMTGTIEAHGTVAIDTFLREKTQVTLSLDQRCRVTRVPPSLDVEQFKHPFELHVYGPHGEPRTATFGPGMASWTDYDEISPYVVDALLTCEDANFFSHRGFSALAIRNAMLANVKAGKFLLGASTLTMQLAKNLFLDRRKVLSRKLQEAVLTAWLEQSMSKSELLELYLNVVELGPDLYGIGPASRHYFGRSPSELDPMEALFLVSILPSPVRSHAMWDRGAVGDGYLKYLHRLLREEHARGLIDDAEYEAFKVAPLTFHKPGDPDPAPRTPTLRGRGKADGKEVDDPAFDPAFAPSAD